MNNVFINLINVIMFMSVFSLCQEVYAADSAGKQEHIKSVTAITEVFGDGQKVTVVAVEYDKAVENSALSKSTFSVAGRTITNVYANTEATKAATAALEAAGAKINRATWNGRASAEEFALEVSKMIAEGIAFLEHHHDHDGK